MEHVCPIVESGTTVFKKIELSEYAQNSSIRKFKMPCFHCKSIRFLKGLNFCAAWSFSADEQRKYHLLPGHLSKPLSNHSNDLAMGGGVRLRVPLLNPGIQLSGRNEHMTTLSIRAYRPLEARTYSMRVIEDL